MFIHITSGFLSVCAMRKTMEVPQGRRDFKKKKTTSNKDLTETIKKKTNLKFLFAVPRSFIASSSFSICLQPILYFCFVFACFSFIVVHSFYFYFFFFVLVYFCKANSWIPLTFNTFHNMPFGWFCSFFVLLLLLCIQVDIFNIPFEATAAASSSKIAYSVSRIHIYSVWRTSIPGCCAR